MLALTRLATTQPASECSASQLGAIMNDLYVRFGMYAEVSLSAANLLLARVRVQARWVYLV